MSVKGGQNKGGAVMSQRKPMHVLHLLPDNTTGKYRVIVQSVILSPARGAIDGEVSKPDPLG